MDHLARLRRYQILFLRQLFQARRAEQLGFLQFQRAALVAAGARSSARRDSNLYPARVLATLGASTPVSRASTRQAAPIALQQAPRALRIGFAHQARIVDFLAIEEYVFLRKGAQLEFDPAPRELLPVAPGVQLPAASGSPPEPLSFA